MKNYRLLLMGISPVLINVNAYSKELNHKQPNVIIVITDDQGIGGLSCQNNPYLKTPCIDKFYAQSVRMTDFHVSPLSTPTRSAIITGRYPIRNGAWATYKGRDIISRNTPTIAEIFKDGGYSTAMFGKWHLGDNYPCRPNDCGFEYAVQHSSGGVGELSDYWGNNYFDDTYLVNTKPKKFKGYCTDIWFEEAEKYISKHKNDSKPFLIYLATNAPHGPHYVAEKYKAPYNYLQKKGLMNDAGFYGQIANIDENFGKFDDFLKKNNLDENTILIFMTDNGAGAADNLWVDGYRGAKGSKLEGGHRVPFYIRWPKAGIQGGKNLNALVAHVDMIPTLAKLCGVSLPKNNKLDGVDFSPLLLHKGNFPENRTVFIHHRQDSKPPFDVNQSCVLRNGWRLLDGNKLYDVENDKLESINLASKNPDLVKELLSENKEFIDQTKLLPEYRNFIPAVAGNVNQKVIVFTIQHAIGNSPGLWKAEQIAEGVKSKNDGYALSFDSDGKYKISLARWPRECQGRIHGVPSINPKKWYNYKVIKPEKAYIKINNKEYTKDIDENMKEVSFVLDFKKGDAFLNADFIEKEDKFGVYYIYIEKI